VPGVHKEMLDRLRLAENALRGEFPGRDDAAIRAELGVRDIGGLRKPKLASGGSLPSMHCFGMAVDINPGSNPFVGLSTVSKKIKDPAERARLAANRSPRVIARAMLMIHGEAFDIEKKLQGGVGDVWEIHDKASKALASYLQLADASDSEVQAAVDRARAAGDPHDLTWWKQRIADDKKFLPSWDFGKHPAPEKSGYMDLPKKLVLALVNDGGLTWGGEYRTAKDIMHFDYRGGSIQRT
jgi:hypothetical protein